MPKYRVEFEEIRRHTVEFETITNIEIVDGSPTDETEWFYAMEAARPDWLNDCSDYFERNLESIDKLPDDHEID